VLCAVFKARNQELNDKVQQTCDRRVAIAQVREISADNVWQWLSAGWRDLVRAPVQSLFYGVSLAALSLGISLGVTLNGSYYLLPPLLAGFVLLAPFLGMGPYSISE